MQLDGWIKLYRKVANNELWLRPEKFDYRSAWVDILLNVAYEDHKVITGNKVIDYKKGTWITSMVELSKRWRWNRRTVKSFLELLKELGNIEFSAQPTNTVITVLNWQKYQEIAQPITQPITQPTAQPIAQHSDTEEGKEIKEDIEALTHTQKDLELSNLQQDTKNKKSVFKENYREFVALTEEEHQKLINQFGEAVTDELLDILNNYKGSCGKKYKSDYLAIHNWVVKRWKDEHSERPQHKKQQQKSLEEQSQEVYEWFERHGK